MTKDCGHHLHGVCASQDGFDAVVRRRYATGHCERTAHTAVQDGQPSELLPGDEVIPEPIGSLTHAITIRGPRSDVWPWLAQMGAGTRAGWYSYDFLDNGRRKSAECIVPQWQRIAVGTLFPALPGATNGFVVVRFEPARFLVLGWPAPDGTFLSTWVADT